VPTASEAATAMETAEAATDMAETSSMGDTHTVRETATPEVGDTYAPIHATQATHAVAEAMIEAAVVRVPAIKHGGVAVVAVITPTQRAAINRIRRQPVRTGVGLGSSRLRSGERSRGQANGSSQ